MVSVFVSYAHEDQDQARQIVDALQRAGAKVFFDAVDLMPGDALLRIIAEHLSKVDYFALVLSDAALNKPWVRTEIDIAVTHEISTGKPTVVALRLDDCTLPVALAAKLHIDFRNGFSAALQEVASLASGKKPLAATKQAVLARMLLDADDELWARLTKRAGEDEFSRTDAADLIYRMRADELEATIAIADAWRNYKMWRDHALLVIKRSTHCSTAGARHLLDAVKTHRLLVLATDLDYREIGDEAYTRGPMLDPLFRAARRSALFPKLCPPVPERLSTFLASDTRYFLHGNGWNAELVNVPECRVPGESATLYARVSRETPARNWLFRSAEDRSPARLERHLSVTELCGGDPLASLRLIPKQERAFLGFELPAFDDLGLLVG